MMKSNENNGAVTKSFAKKMESISPFELKNKLIEMADESIKKIAHTMLNAGRGNPNWIATTPREAFFLLGKFGLEECRRVMYLPEGIAGIPQKDGIAARFETFLKTNHSQPGAELLKGTYQYMLLEHAADPDTLVHEWAEGVVGDQYPVPDRILQFTEMIVQDYLAQEMCDRRPPKGKYDLFATEGGTAAMCYVFDSLQENFLLNKGDGIALMVPVFTPYIEIPQLRRYEFNVTEISADQMTTDGLHTWQYKDEDIDRLRNPQIKALFITNPSNPPSYTLSPETAARIVDIVKSHISCNRMFRSLHIPSIKRLQVNARSFRLVGVKRGSGIFTTSAKRVMKWLIEKQRSVHTRITSQISSIPSDSDNACSTVSNVEVMPAVVLFTSCAIIRITFSYAFFSAFITSSVNPSIR